MSRTTATAEPINPRIMSRATARKALGGIGDTKYDELVSSGVLVRVRIGRRAFVTTASVNAYLDRIIAEAETRSAATA